MDERVRQALAQYMGAVGRGPIPSIQPMQVPDLQQLFVQQAQQRQAEELARQSTMQELQSAVSRNTMGTPVGMAAPPLVTNGMQDEADQEARKAEARRNQALALFLSQLPAAGAGIGRSLDSLFSKNNNKIES